MRQRKDESRILFRIIIIVLIAVIIFSAYKIYEVLYDYTACDNTYKEIAQEATTIYENASGSTDSAATDTTDDSNETDITAAAGTDAAEQSNYDESADNAIAMSVDFDVLSAINGDIIGWIYSPGTQLNYPIVQGDDNDYYLSHLSDKTDGKSGAVFVDYRNNAFADTNTVVYGHNMKNGSMFGALVDYKDQSYYEEHPVIYIFAPGQTYELRLICGAIIDRDYTLYDEGVGRDEDMSDTIKSLTDSSTFTSGETYLPGDRLVTLSTCSYEFNNARFVVVGKLAAID